MAAGAKEAPTFKIEGAQIIFRNFKGEEGPYNAKGDRNFCVILPPELEPVLVRDGWNVKYLDSRQEGEPDIPYVQVRVAYKNKPPLIVVLSSGSRQRLTEEMVDVLDYAEVANVDIICRGYEWEAQGKTGTKAYLKTMFVTVEEDELERKYAGGGD